MFEEDSHSVTYISTSINHVLIHGTATVEKRET